MRHLQFGLLAAISMAAVANFSADTGSGSGSGSGGSSPKAKDLVDKAESVKVTVLVGEVHYRKPLPEGHTKGEPNPNDEEVYAVGDSFTVSPAEAATMQKLADAGHVRFGDKPSAE